MKKTFSILLSATYLLFSGSSIAWELNNSSLIGSWKNVSVTCLSSNKTYRSSGWSLTFEPTIVSSLIDAQCHVSYSLGYKSSATKIYLNQGTAHKICAGQTTTVLIEKMSLNYSLQQGHLILRAANSYCHGIANYEFISNSN